MSSAPDERRYEHDGHPNPSKKMRSQPPDVVIAVGEGDKMQEFECYSIILCFASPDYFDSMLSLQMKESETRRIVFPDKNPEEWKEVYKFIDYETKDTAHVTNDNVHTLLPWFHMLQMTGLIVECDKVLSEMSCLFTKSRKSRRSKRFTSNEEIVEAKDRLFSLFCMAHMYGLKKTMRGTCRQLKVLIKQHEWMIQADDVIKILEVVDPQEKREARFAVYVWDWVKNDILQGVDISDEHKDKGSILQNPLFSKLLSLGMQTKLQAQEMEQKAQETISEVEDDATMLRTLATKLVDFIVNIPEELYEVLPNRKTTGFDVTIDDFCCKKLRRLLWQLSYVFSLRCEDREGILEAIPEQWGSL